MFRLKIGQVLEPLKQFHSDINLLLFSIMVSVSCQITLESKCKLTELGNYQKSLTDITICLQSDSWSFNSINKVIEPGVLPKEG